MDIIERIHEEEAEIAFFLSEEFGEMNEEYDYESCYRLGGSLGLSDDDLMDYELWRLICAWDEYLLKIV